jgi:hypothetical protein
MNCEMNFFMVIILIKEKGFIKHGMIIIIMINEMNISYVINFYLINFIIHLKFFKDLLPWNQKMLIILNYIY